MANNKKARHAFGNSSGIEAALQAGTIDAYDILFLDGDTEPKIGWIDAQGNIRLVENEADFSELEAIIATKANASDVEALESAMAKKAKKYEIAKMPSGTLVDYFNKEVRIMIPSDVDFTQDNGISGTNNAFYIESRIYAPEGAVKYKVDFGGQALEGNVEDFSGCTDEYGRVYIVNALPVAYYDTESAAWVYHGVNSTSQHYIGWNQVVYWYDANEIVVGSDSIRINLSNEDCHYVIEPYYMGEMSANINTLVEEKVEEKIAEVETAYEIIEF